MSGAFSASRRRPSPGVMDLPASWHPGRLQALFRDVNERIAAASKGTLTAFVCECLNGDCTEPVRLTLREYRAIRKIPTRFLTAPGHQHADEERVVVREARFQVVEKLGEARMDAILLDRRRAERTPELDPAG